MIIRVWRTELDPARVGEYDRFAHTVSAPMFRSQPGCLGVFFARGAVESLVVTLWADRASLRRLDHSATYQATVERILAGGFLRPPQSVEVAEITGGYLADGEALARALALLPDGNRT